MKKFKFKNKIMAVGRGSFVKTVFVLHLFNEGEFLTWCPSGSSSIMVVCC